MIRPEKIKRALADVEALQVQYPWSVALKSIVEQLNYLIELEAGDSHDRSKLPAINIGVLAAREVEDMDRSIADQLHSISADIKSMIGNPRA